MEVRERYVALKKRIPSSVAILFACKYATDDQIGELHNMDSHLVFGENYVQKAKDRTVKIHRNRYHLIGHLQRNKVRDAVRIFGTIQSVDSKSLLEKLSNVATEEKLPVEIYLQVKLDDNKNQRGIMPEAVGELVAHTRSLPSLRLIGLMTLGTINGNKRDAFKRLKSFATKYHLKTSMGMSEDYEEAINEGSDMVRIGRILFK